jgi:hypothetical protein
VSDLRQREPRLIDEGFLAFVRTKSCAFCGAKPVQAAHIRMADLTRGKPFTGRMRPDDRWCTPLCQWCHLDGPEAQHKIGEERFWKIAEINPFVLAESLYAEYGGDGGKPRRKRSIIRPRLPKERRRTIPSRKLKGKKGYGQRN